MYSLPTNLSKRETDEPFEADSADPVLAISPDAISNQNQANQPTPTVSDSEGAASTSFPTEGSSEGPAQLPNSDTLIQLDGAGDADDQPETVPPPASNQAPEESPENLQASPTPGRDAATKDAASAPFDTGEPQAESMDTGDSVRVSNDGHPEPEPHETAAETPTRSSSIRDQEPEPAAEPELSGAKHLLPSRRRRPAPPLSRRQSAVASGCSAGARVPTYSPLGGPLGTG